MTSSFLRCRRFEALPEVTCQRFIRRDTRDTRSRRDRPKIQPTVDDQGAFSPAAVGLVDPDTACRYCAMSAASLFAISPTGTSVVDEPHDKRRAPSMRSWDRPAASST